MILTPSKDDALKVLSRPEIFETISEDGMDHVPMPDGPIYLCGYVPELIGCFILHKRSKVTVECHVQVLPEYRKDYAREFGRSVIQWTWNNTNAEKIVAEIPVIYPNVKDFALEMGFEIEGMNKASHMKHELVDQWYLGISR
jgi:hypothetical protein